MLCKKHDLIKNPSYPTALEPRSRQHWAQRSSSSTFNFNPTAPTNPSGPTTVLLLYVLVVRLTPWFSGDSRGPLQIFKWFPGVLIVSLKSHDNIAFSCSIIAFVFCDQWAFLCKLLFIAYFYHLKFTGCHFLKLYCCHTVTEGHYCFTISLCYMTLLIVLAFWFIIGPLLRLDFYL